MQTLKKMLTKGVVLRDSIYEKCLDETQICWDKMQISDCLGDGRRRWNKMGDC